MSEPLPPDAVLEGLDPEQREVARHPLGPMVVLAGAGTGKTRAITHRIAYGVSSGVLTPQRMLALTFTARAAGEMRSRLRGLGAAAVQARTFHSAALRQLQFFWPQAVGGPAPQVLSQKAPAVAEAAGRLRLRLERTELRDVAAEIEWAKVGMVTAERYPAVAQAQGRSPAGLDGTAMARLMQTYAEVTAERNVIDFEDVLLLTVGILVEHESVAASVRQQYRHFVVDEYQDVNPLQHRLLDLWVGDRTDVCVVGDPAQTIYSFTGATPQYLMDFGQRFPDAATVSLVRNYRSTPQVIELANVMLAAASAVERGSQTPLTLRSQQQPGPCPELTQYPDDEAEARGVAQLITEMVSSGGAAPGDIAVLFRTNAQSAAVESALSGGGTPYVVRGAERFFSRAEVRQAMVLLRGQVRSDTAEGPLAARVRDVLSSLGHTARPPEGGATRERWESLQALVHLAQDMEAPTTPESPVPGGGPMRVGEFVAELDRRAGEQHPPAVDGVTLASLHAAKGLEWDHVFVIGCSEGLLPITMAEGPERVAEEQRLLYVGVTRARVGLHLSWAGSRSTGGRTHRKVSRFLHPAAEMLGMSVPQRRKAVPAAPGRPRSRRVCRTCGSDLDTAAERKIGRCSACPATYDEALFEQLRSWRAETAKRDRVPAFVVFTDATLTAIAEQVPSELGALSKISGVGTRKLEMYGPDVLQILADH
ncbi:MAG: ATP-dependent DNA helicase UvrD2 [Ornithinimicrobium sp.]